MSERTTPRSDDRLLRLVVVVLGAILLLPLLLMALAMPMMGMMGGLWSGGMMGGYSPFWGVGMMLVWLLVLVGIGYALYRAFVGGTRGPTDPAMEELRVAYARGELTDEEFEQRRERLRRGES